MVTLNRVSFAKCNAPYFLLYLSFAEKAILENLTRFNMNQNTLKFILINISILTTRLASKKISDFKNP